MKSITIHGLQDPLDSLIRKQATKQGLSLNKTIKKLLAESLGLKSKKEVDHRMEFMDLFGVWTEEDLEEFSRAVQDFEEIDEGEWQ